MMFEILHRAFVSLCGFLCTECAKVAAPAGFGILLARIQAVLSGFQFLNHKMPRPTLMRGIKNALTISQFDREIFSDVVL